MSSFSGVALTGSEGAGRAVAAKAGGLMKKAVIELGGSDAYAVLADADLDVAADAVVNARVANSGQTLAQLLLVREGCEVSKRKSPKS